MNYLTQNLPSCWHSLLQEEISQPYWQNLDLFLTESYQKKIIYPPKHQIFTALELTPPHQVQVVILGQDPYHGPNQAHGLSFSVLPQTPLPPSLKNIFRELKEDCGIDNGDHGCLIPWAKQGVLLLNSVLTVEKDQAGSHAQKGWENFTDAIICQLNLLPQSIIFLLWGGWAQKKKKLITSPHHFILEAPHPSPLSVFRGFYGCKHFSKVNQLLLKQHLSPIDWTIK